jgi:uncharacterized protein YjbI with pentapeptide repeats
VEDRSLVTIDLRQMDLRGAVLGPVSLNAAALQGADLRGARLVGVELEGAHLGHADLRGADLTSCDFHEADVTGADFRGAWLPADRMDPTGLGEALFAGAHYRSTTEWPAGFDPDAAGAVLDA